MSSSSAEEYCVSFDDVTAACERVREHVHVTPLLRCSTLSRMAGVDLLLKCENFQKTGSFKFRGAVNAVLSAASGDLRAVATHSSGNHGQAVAGAARLVAAPAFVVMPRSAPRCKKEAVRRYGGVVMECVDSERARAETAERVTKEHGATFVHSSQDARVIAGQATMAVEILDARPDVDAIVAPVGGGGMLAGIALAAKQLRPSIAVYGAEPAVADDCYRSKRSGVLTGNGGEYPDTVADGARVSVGARTWPIIRDLVDDVVVVSEAEIVAATRLLWERAKLVVEPTGAVGVAAALKAGFGDAERPGGPLTTVAVIVCGGNCDIKAVAALFEP